MHIITVQPTTYMNKEKAGYAALKQCLESEYNATRRILPTISDKLETENSQKGAHEGFPVQLIRNALLHLSE